MLTNDENNVLEVVLVAKFNFGRILNKQKLFKSGPERNAVI